MKLTTARVVAEIVAFLVFLLVIEWLSTRLLQTDNFWPRVVYIAIYIGVRAVLFARKSRSL